MDSFDNALDNIVEFLPLLLAFLLIIVIGLIIARVVEKLVAKVLERVGFDRAVERGGIKTALENSKYDASDIVSKLVYYAIALFVLQLAFGVFGPNPISELLTDLISFLPAIIVAIIIIVVAAAIAKAVQELIANTLSGLSYGKLLGRIAGVFILGLGIIAALNQVGVATTVTTPILIFVLATVGGVIVVGAGGGLIKPMQQRWEGWLSGAERESSKVRAEAAAAPSVREQAEQARARYMSSGDTAVTDTSDSGTAGNDYPPPSTSGAYPPASGSTAYPPAPGTPGTDYPPPGETDYPPAPGQTDYPRSP